MSHYFQEEEVEIQPKKEDQAQQRQKVQEVFTKLAKFIEKSNFNLTYAVKFIRKGDDPKIEVSEFLRLLEWIDSGINQEELETLLYELRDEQGMVNTKEFVSKLEISSRALALILDEKVWQFASLAVNSRILKAL